MLLDNTAKFDEMAGQQNQDLKAALLAKLAQPKDLL